MFAIKDNDVVYISVRARGHLCTGEADNEWYNLPDNANVWKIPNDDDIIVGVSGGNFAASLLKFWPDFITGELSKDRIVTQIAPDLKELLSTYGKIDQDGYMPYTFVFAQKNRAYFLTVSFDCYEMGEYESRNNLLASALEMSKDMPIEKRLRFVAEIEEENSRGSMPTFVIDTKTMKPYLVK